MIHVVDSCYLSKASANACSRDRPESNSGSRVVVCGSPNEVANGSRSHQKNTYSFPRYPNINAGSQKKDVWNAIALRNDDQLRQRVAW